MLERARVEAVARCLARIDGRFIGAVAWTNGVGDRYRARARRYLDDHERGERELDYEVLRTLERYDAGWRSGGLPFR